MPALDSSAASALLNAILRQTSTASTTGINVRLGSSTPSASGTQTSIPSGSGYVTAGSACVFAAASSGTAANTSTLSWTNSGSTWTINGIELWDQAGGPVRWMFGTWTGAPLSVSTGNTFQVSAGGIVASLQ